MLITRLDPDALSDLAAMLAGAGLPVADLAEPDRLFFRFDDHGRLFGFAGLEGDDNDDRLLRSLVVAADRRREGVGMAILVALEQQAAMLDIRRLHLLTMTAAGFFKANGYVAADRLTAPPIIAASREFTALCPASAAYLVKTLGAA
jgi:N-acetylglutamate synthase-like GNAT family acetyltransferase